MYDSRGQPRVGSVAVMAQHTAQAAAAAHRLLGRHRAELLLGNGSVAASSPALCVGVASPAAAAAAGAAGVGDSRDGVSGGGTLGSNERRNMSKPSSSDTDSSTKQGHGNPLVSGHTCSSSSSRSKGESVHRQFSSSGVSQGVPACVYRLIGTVDKLQVRLQCDLINPVLRAHQRLGTGNRLIGY